MRTLEPVMDLNPSEWLWTIINRVADAVIVTDDTGT